VPHPARFPTGRAAGGEEAEQQLPFSPAPIEGLLRSFVKAMRAHQLYVPNNPVYKGAIDAVRAAFRRIWQVTDEVTLTVTESDIRWFGHPVLTQEGKTSDSLAWMFFKDGVRGVSLNEGFESDELIRLFGILERIRRDSPDEDDLLTLLWQADFANLRYWYVEPDVEAVEAIAGRDTTATSPPADAVRAAVEAAVEAPEAESLPGVVDLRDFDATLYFLDDTELDYLQREIDREHRSDLRENVIAILLDIWEEQPSPTVREDISEIIEGLLLLVLSAGQYHSAACLLTETQVAVQRGKDVTPAQRDRMGRLPERLSAPEPLSQLLQALDESIDLPPQQELNELFELLRPAALETIFASLSRLQNPRMQELLRRAADRLAGANTGEVVKLIGVPDRGVALEAIRRAGALGTPAAVAPLTRALGDPDTSFRRAAALSLVSIGSAGALKALEPFLEDSDRDVRVIAVRALSGRAHRALLPRVEAIVKDRALRAADLTEKMAFFEAYGAMCGDSGIGFLSGILNGKPLFGKREGFELRACAAMALGQIGSPKAVEALRRSASDRDVVVRNAVNRALLPDAETE
jgi:HEAT repeat protein